MAETTVQGIDVSHFQGAIQWEEVAKAGIKFAFIKATDGIKATDPMFSTNWQRAKRVGLRRGAYHFFRAQQDSERQAQNFLAMLKDDAGELPPVLDFELLCDASPEQGMCAAKRWMEIVEQEIGVKPILYTGPGFWISQLGNTPVMTQHLLWIAHYTAAMAPQLPAAWSRWTFWQHSEKGTVSGIKGPVDLDRFNGTLMELNVLTERIQEKSALVEL